MFYLTFICSDLVGIDHITSKRKQSIPILERFQYNVNLLGAISFLGVLEIK